jgi:hypothetical protein
LSGLFLKAASRAIDGGSYRHFSSGVAWQWWDGEIERRAALHRAICLHKAYTMQRDQPTSQVPTYLEARVAAGHAVPVVEVVSPQSQKSQQGAEQAGASGKRGAASEGGGIQGADTGDEAEVERHAVLAYVVKGLNEALATELLEGFHGPYTEDGVRSGFVGRLKRRQNVPIVLSNEMGPEVLAGMEEWGIPPL